jgi:uncharacterized protein (TIGR02996 family)
VVHLLATLIGRREGMMKGTGAALLRAVVENPDDDGVRLVYADWLDEQGDPERAEFIRVQVRLAGSSAGARGRAADERRERELLAAHADEWLKPFRKWLREPWGHLLPRRPRWQFRRGFLERVTLSVETFRKHGERLLDAAPIREAWFPDCEGDDLAELGGVETLRRLTALDLAGSNYTDGTDEFLYSEHLAGLRRLDFYCYVEDEGMGGAVWGPLVSSETLAGLEELLLTAHPMDADTFAYLDRHFALPGLRKLGLEGVVRLDAPVARIIARSKSMGRIEALAVTRQHVAAPAMTIVRRRFGKGLLVNEVDPDDEGWKPCF